MDGFTPHRIDTGETTIFVQVGGDGPPLLLLHGFPQTHRMWRDMAPLLSPRFRAVCADLRGYGDSGCPPSAPDHGPYAKRAMAADLVAIMDHLGHERFGVCGHDRGGRVAYRLALDHPERITRLAVLDVLPVETVWARADARMALGFWPWSLLAQDPPLPETLLTLGAQAIVDNALSAWGSAPGAFPPEVRAAYVAALQDPDHAHAICEEYRAAAGLARAHDCADLRAGRRIACPLLALWSRDGALGQWYAHEGGPLALRRDWADDVEGEAVDGGHFFPEEHPRATAERLASFFAT